LPAGTSKKKTGVKWVSRKKPAVRQNQGRTMYRNRSCEYLVTHVYTWSHRPPYLTRTCTDSSQQQSAANTAAAEHHLAWAPSPIQAGHAPVVKYVHSIPDASTAARAANLHTAQQHSAQCDSQANLFSAAPALAVQITACPPSGLHCIQS
jgi:hypothetical protein